MELYGPNGNLLMRLMSASTDRSRVIAGNIANQNTPGYKQRTLEFESLLTREIESMRPDLESIAPTIDVDKMTPGKPNGNNVDMEREVATMRENLLRYEMYATIMSGNTKLVQSAIHGER